MGIRPAKICEASKLQSLFGASRLKASKPQSCKASLAPHASKPQSSKASLAPHASKPQSCKASLAPHASKPQSLKAWTLGCFGALALGGSFRLWRFLALFRRLKASKPERLDAVALWRFGAWRLLTLCFETLLETLFRRLKASKPERLDAWWRFCKSARVLRLKASKPERLDALALWRLALQHVWRLGTRLDSVAPKMIDALVPLGPLALCGSLTLWRFGAWRSWCFGASWPFGALRLFDALALLGRFETSRLCDALALCAALWVVVLVSTCHLGKKRDFVDFTFFARSGCDLKHRYKSCFWRKKQRARLFVFEGQRSPAASELTTTCLVIFVGCLMMVYLK